MLTLASAAQHELIVRVGVLKLAIINVVALSSLRATWVGIVNLVGNGKPT